MTYSISPPSVAIKPTKANTSAPPRTTSFISTPWFPNTKLIQNVTPGGVLAAALTAAGLTHIAHNIKNQIE